MPDCENIFKTLLSLCKENLFWSCFIFKKKKKIIIKTRKELFPAEEIFNFTAEWRKDVRNVEISIRFL